MKEKIYCNWFNIAMSIIGLGIILDIGVAVTKFSLFTATEAYMDYLFSAIVSVELLTVSLIALVSGILQEKYFGYKLSELLVFEGIKKRINLRRYIIASLFQIILGVFLLSLFFRISCVNSMIYLLVSAIFSAGCMTYSIFDIMVNDQVVYNILEDGYEYLLEKNFSSSKRYLHHINTLTNALIEATENGNLEETEEICSLYSVLFQVVDKNKDIEWEQISYLKTRLQQVCCKISTAFGYFKTIEEITKMFRNISNYNYWKIDLYLNPIKELKYFDDEQLEKCDYKNQVLEICILKEYKDGIISADDWKNILYQYFLSLIKNKSCTCETKYEILNYYLAELVNFTRNCDDGTLLSEEIVALYILNYILNIEDKNEQKKIYISLIRNITVHNQHRKSKDYYLFLSIIVQVFYSYSYKEEEVRTVAYRKCIRQLLNTEISDNIIDGLKIAFLLEANIEQIISGFGFRIPKDLPIVNIFEASSDFMFVKYKIWTEEYNIKFFFMLYCQYYDLLGFYRIISFLHWDEYSTEIKNKILKSFITYFDKELGLLQKSFIEECRQLGKLYNHNYAMTNREQRNVYEFIQEQQRELIDIKLSEKQPDEEGKIDTREITNYLDAIMKRNNVYGWAPERKMDFYIKYSDIKIVMHYVDNFNIVHEKTVANLIESFGQDAFNQFIRNKCRKILVTYDDEGIKKVLQYINDTNYSIRSFSYSSDWALAKYSKTEEYQMLKEKENAIELCRVNFIHEHIYAKKDNFYFKLVTSKAKMRNLNEEECLERLDEFNRYKEYYYVDGVLLDRIKAIECIKRKYYMYEFDFKLYLEFNPEDVTWFCNK